MADPSMREDEELNRQYGSTDRLTTRAGVWRPAPGHLSAPDAVVEAASGDHPLAILDIGCGTGDLTERLVRANPDALVHAVDRSAAMVDATRDRGIDAMVATVTALPFEDHSFDAVTCAWVLYHVPALGQALREIGRVLRPGGRAVLATNSDRHLARLFEDSGVERPRLSFTSQNAAGLLMPHFAEVRGTEHPSLAHFEDRAAARAYLATLPTFRGEEHLPDGGWPRDYEGLAAVFTCRDPREPRG